ncbi:class I SAM-dependent methyltransferase [Streptomyces albiaxialis]|uniref:Class I SAM-dependent methyltransferase n=1 Tax=Streptomyces albiaxialis TaxID=329523 RepID=A0ABN2VME3_9ACTN
MPPIPTGSAEPADPRDIVRRGYDALAERYDEAFGSAAKYGPWLDELRGHLAPGSDVLDLGCGGGVPVARELAAAGHRVTGVDISPRQIARARERVPGAVFVEADLTDPAAFGPTPRSFDAVVCLYALIHVPEAEHPALLRRIAAWLRPGGRLLCTTGQDALTGSDPDWLGGGVPMWWSHPDAATSRAWLTEAGLDVVRQEFVPEGDGGHALFWARKAATA